LKKTTSSKTRKKLRIVTSEKDDLDGKLDSHQIEFASHLPDLPPPSFAPLIVQNASQKKKKTKRSSVGISEPPNLPDLPPPSFAPLIVQNASQKKKMTKRSSVGISEPPNQFAEYNNYIDRMAEWNVHIERKETGAERGKGV